MAAKLLSVYNAITISGRVLSPTGKGLARVRVTITDRNGESRNVQTNSFGYYRFNDIRAGETYTVNINSKRYRFASQVFVFTQSNGNLNFTAQP